MMLDFALMHYHLTISPCIFIETHHVGHVGEKTWLLGNINQTGYFRVNYDLHNWRLLIQQLMINPTVCSYLITLLLLYFIKFCFSLSSPSQL